MKQLPCVVEIENNSRVIVRIDTDLPAGDNSRLKKSIPTIIHLLGKGCKLVILGHLGRPEGREEKYSLRSVYVELMALLTEEKGEVASVFLEDFANTDEIDRAVDANEIVMLENMRFYPGEATNDPVFAQKLAQLGDVFVMDAFAVAHRKVASVMLVERLPSYFGFAFIEEYEALSRAMEGAKSPMLVILGGTKKDKLDYLEKLLDVADKVALVGKMPVFYRDSKQFVNKKLMVSELNESGFDISLNSAAIIADMIRGAEVVIWAGSAGKWEDIKEQNGSRLLSEALGESSAYTIVAGGDTSAGLRRFNMEERVSFVASGGGSMLEFLTTKTLPVILNYATDKKEITSRD